ncbi:restriction endonuclease subunit S [Shewanella xiamenensis]|uniref:restriction endonuclease subunit S n=1 Tax=Shewanella xiamenensis TaxID=332186 RepID=UPI00313AB9CB
MAALKIENLITDHLDLWTAAVRPKSSAGRGNNSKLELTGIKKLRELILELAVRGKLVPQDPSDEPASVLLERIAAEKVRLVKEGKIKKPKALPEIAEDEKPFELPVGWEFARLGVFGETNIGLTYSPNDVGENGIPVLRSSNIQQGKIDLSDLVRVNKDVKESSLVALGDLLICARNGSKSLVGKTAQIKSLDEPMAFGAFMAVFRSELNNYIELFLNSPLFRRNLEGVSTTTINQITQNNLKETVCTIPPLKEQHRIVAKVDELMALCDQLELRSESQLAAHQTLVETLLATLTDSANAYELAQNWARLSTHFDTLFTTEASIEALKQTILQLAVMGKLVPQDPSDEPASALLARIAAEKALLVKEKKIKKEKPLPAISEDEKPFELPQGWVWSRISESSLFCEYGSSEKTLSELSDGVPVLKMGDIQDGKVILGSHQVVSPKIDDLPNLYLKKGDILYNRTNSAELVGKTGMFDGDDDTYTFASYLIRIRCSIHNIRPEYLTLCMNSPLFRKTQIEPHIKQQCGQANVNGTLMKSMLVSIPPYHEQVLILQKIHELMTLCDQLKSRLQTSQQTQLALAESLVEGALA